MKFLAKHNNALDFLNLKNAPENFKLIAPSIQKDIINAIAIETKDIIMKDIGDVFFSPNLVDESHDISMKEKMAIMLRYVNKIGCVVKRSVSLLEVAKKHI